MTIHPYRNPVIPGFYPDPSICRVGEDYYLVNSTFEYFPGVPVWHSRDLVNWRQLGNVLDRTGQLDLTGCPCSDGIYAPTIRYHQGLFYMVTTLVKAGQFTNFYVTSENPAGSWSDPIVLDQSGIDPSIFFHPDGRVFLQTNRAMSFDTPRAIYQSEIDLSSGRRIKGPVPIWAGTGGSYVEGPHLYQREDYYYLLAAEGGTAYGHMVTIARSRDPWGPFESCPHNPILSNRHAYESIHGTGHGDLVEAVDGTWWMVHLGFRKTVGEVHTLGRETCLAPVTWVDDWPVVNQHGTIGESVTAPTPGLQASAAGHSRDVFADGKIGADWIKLRHPEDKNYSFTEREGFLRMHPAKATLDDLASPTFMAKRQCHFDVRISTLMEFKPVRAGQRAGMSLMMTNRHRYDLAVVWHDGARRAVVDVRLDRLAYRAAEWLLPAEDAVELVINCTRETYDLGCRLGGRALGGECYLDSRYLATEVTGGYNGVVVGLFVEGGEHGVPADFVWFDYAPVNP